MPARKKKATSTKPPAGLSDERFRANVEALSKLIPSHSARVQVLDQIIAGRDFLAEHLAMGREVPGDEPAQAPKPSSGPPAGMATTHTAGT